MALAIVMSAPLVAQYATRPGVPTVPSCEAMWMMEPPPPRHGGLATAHEEGAADVDAEHRVPAGEVEIEHRRGGIAHRGAVHQDVQRAERLGRAFHRLPGRGLRRDVALERERALPGQPGRLLCVCQVQVDAGHPGAGVRESDRDRAADSAAGAGDDRTLAAQREPVVAAHAHRLPR
jgi:hypothetical protein